MAAEPITLDDFFTQAAPIELVNLSAQLGTVSPNERPDSVWQGDSYGSTLFELLGRPANTVAMAVELQRSLSVVGLDGAVEVTTDETAVIPTMNGTIVVDREGVTLVT